MNSNNVLCYFYLRLILNMGAVFYTVPNSGSTPFFLLFCLLPYVDNKTYILLLKIDDIFIFLWWSGITKLVCGARGEDVESITSFREGPLPANWPDLLSKRRDLPIEVVRDVQRERACAVLRAYMASGQPVYNPGSTA